MAILVVAGTLNGIAILDTRGMAWSDTYLTWLAVKLVLAGLMIALALTNRFGVLPGLARGEAEAAETLPLTVFAELGVRRADSAGCRVPGPHRAHADVRLAISFI